MPYLNKAMLIGNIGKDPEIKVTQGGRKRATLYVEGAIAYRSWDDRETGQRRYATGTGRRHRGNSRVRSQGRGRAGTPTGSIRRKTRTGFRSSPQTRGTRLEWTPHRKRLQFA